MGNAGITMALACLAVGA